MDVNIFVICHFHVNASKPEVTTAISLTFVKVVNKVHNAPVVVTKIVVNYVQDTLLRQEVVKHRKQ